MTGKYKASVEQQETEILLPDRELIINGEKITVREFKFLEAARAGTRARGLIEDLHKLMESAAGDMKLLDLEAVFMAHTDVMLELIATATGKPVEWIGDLSDNDGRTLMLTFWSVNRDFFINRMVTLSLDRLSGTVLEKSLPH